MDLATPRAALRLAACLAARPGTVLRRGAGLVAELGQVGLGVSTVAPHPGDDRFTGRLTDPLGRRAVQTWLATTGTLSALLDELDEQGGGAGPHLPAGEAARLRAALAALADLTCPAGDGEPDTGRRARPVPGRDLAATPGAVVLRTPAFELLQYLPRTDRVRDVPVLVVPPSVHRYYLADLAPGHSLVEHLVGAGQQVFALSPADPGPDLDTGVAAVLEAVRACARITRCPRVVLLGVRTGGLLAAAVQARLAALGDADRVAAAVYLGTVLDQHAALPGFRLDTAAAPAWVWRRGGEQLHPYAVAPGAADRLPDGPARDALRYWASDLLALPPVLHDELAALAGADPDGPTATVLGTPVEPHLLTADAYLVTAADDPVQPWTAGLRTAQRLGGACRLVRAPGDQVGALFPDPRGAHAGPVRGGGTPAGWEATSTPVAGSWWADLAAWLAERTGDPREAPPELGGRRLHPIHPAPGTCLGR